ncbi:FAD binding domain-containing protein [Xinfangfangia pollutisoli]|uniref:FAD binding domain-containing protein n=1 Tax=Xinfangfangia pollutisoli TaxID=2865960 RepID=UPI001CD4AF7C|nr:xanthine dehydrogenase family protein subunit M [Xinfangfangia pollutisoli]
MNEFQIIRPAALSDAVAAFNDAEEAMYLSGGMTLIPSMKARLAAPQLLIDLSGLPEMQGISDSGLSLRIGAMTRWAEILRSDVVAGAIPELARLVGQIADRHVRNRGTIGGSIANNDPAADCPAAVLGLGATLITDRREIAADDFYLGLFTTALEEDEILVAIDFPKPQAAAYAKHPHPASGYAVAGVMVARMAQGWRVAVTGAGADGAFRLTELEAALQSGPVEAALEKIDVSAIQVLNEPAFPADFRRQLILWLARESLGRLAV